MYQNLMKTSFTRTTQAVLLVLLPFMQVFAGEETPSSFSQKTSYGRIEVTLISVPPKVKLDGDTFLTIRVQSPKSISVQLPPIDDRLQGFILAGQLDKPAVSEKNSVILERQYRLTPILSEKYRVAPFAVRFTDNSKGPTESGWFATKPFLLEAEIPALDDSHDGIVGQPEPLWVYPSVKTIAMWLAIAVLAAFGLFLLSRLFRKVHREIKLMRMSPRERALFELNELITRDLPTQDLVKEFYLELTMIVRRYIERAHKVRAPEQTTEEFLTAVSQDSRFSEAVLQTLKDFLEAADLVKFAAHKPKPTDIDNATETARKYFTRTRHSALTNPHPAH